MAIGAATATAAALTVGIPAEPKTDVTARIKRNIGLTSTVNPWQFSDLTFYDAASYDVFQTNVDLLIRGIVESNNRAAALQEAGIDLPSIVKDVLASPNLMLSSALGEVLSQIPVDLGQALGGVYGDATPVVLQALEELYPETGGISDLLSLLTLVGLDLSDPLNLAERDIPGLDVVTAGPVFTLLKMLGVDLGWVPELPNSVAAEINSTGYLQVGADGLLSTVVQRLTETQPDNPLIGQLQGVIDNLPIDAPAATQVRVPVAMGVGLGAFAIATGYDKVVADLPNQPGGLNYTGDNAAQGSVTVLPMLLLFNPARPNGGALARFYPMFDSADIDVVNPRTEITTSGTATIIPMLIDVGVAYHPMSDLAAWANPFSLANNAMAGLFPTYMLRGLDFDAVQEQIDAQIAEAAASAAEGNPLALNLYVTIPPVTLPLLEPLYLLSDAVHMMGGPQLNFFTRLANALAPALTSLVNLGYTDVFYNPVTGAFERSYADAGTPVPFGTRPTFDLGFVIGVVLTQLVVGFWREFLSGNPTPPTPNVLATLQDFLSGNLFRAVAGGLSSIVVAPPADEDPEASENALLSAESTEEGVADETFTAATFFSTEALSSGEELEDEAVVEELAVGEDVVEESVDGAADHEVEVADEIDAGEDTVASEDDPEKDPDEADSDEQAVSQNSGNLDDTSGSYTPRHAEPEDTVDSYTPRHAKPDDTSGSYSPRHAKPDDTSGSSSPRHAKPDDTSASSTPRRERTESAGPGGSIIRDTANAFRPGRSTTKPSGGGRHAAADDTDTGTSSATNTEGGAGNASASDAGASDSAD
ncbi:PE-PPE domain-containing protein [Mycolicibacterium moriokaense]|uniref:PE-PPE domain-containing protein n=1 Tax=Mycolicibacterium moriokaense TaxID=39691 RepID=UPI0009F5FFFA|nr:PE-PPE domain-containing protein [Mycolicibacterium moriokaense]MCV7037739.1 PE-PPE domain-containing protein [Mycolicibacterium moriokaense]